MEEHILTNIDEVGTPTKEILDRCKLQKGAYSMYRDRLSRKGLIDTSTFGRVGFSLPRFFEFVKAKKEYDF